MNLDKVKKKYKSVFIFVLIGCLFFTYKIQIAVQVAAMKGISVFYALTEKTNIYIPDKLYMKPFGICLFFTGLALLWVYATYINEKNTRDNEEYGSSKFETNLKPFKNKNMSGCKTLYTTSLIKMKDYKESPLFLNTNKTGVNYKKNDLGNLHSLVIGGSGSGKSFRYVIPNILQANTSFVITDPKGELLNKTGKYLEAQGYKIKVFNIEDMEHSFGFNSFKYLKNSDDITVMVQAFMENTGGKNQGGNAFWDQMTTIVLEAFCNYVFSFMKDQPEKQNWFQVAEMVRQAKPVRDQNGEFQKTVIDNLMEEANRIEPNTMCYIKYQNFKSASGSEETISNIITSVIARLSLFDGLAIRRLTTYDTLNLEDIGKEKTALFCITPAANSTYNFLIAMLYIQLFDVLIRVAKENGEQLPIYTRFILDEFANICKIPKFDEYLAYVRSFGISIAVIIQSISQLKSKYKDDYETIIGNCDTFLFLGSPEYNTCKYISDLLGNGTIREVQITTSKKQAKHRKMQRKIMEPSEVRGLERDKCIVLYTGSKNPVLDAKIDTMNLPNFKRTFLYTKKQEDFYKTSNVISLNDVLKNLKSTENEVKEIPSVKEEIVNNNITDLSNEDIVDNQEVVEEYLKDNNNITEIKIEDLEDTLKRDFGNFPKDDLEKMELLECYNCPWEFKSSDFKCSEPIIFDD